MAEKKEHFGRMADGREISLYTIDNGTVSASFTDLGAVWVSMMVPDRNGELADVLLGYDEQRGIWSMAPISAPSWAGSANRTGGASFTLNGTSYVLGKNKGENNLHSGPDYYDRRLWAARKRERIPWYSFWTVPTATRDFPES